MNILFALYNDFNCNSANHVHNFANELVKLGHDCAVAVPFNKDSVSNLGSWRYRPVEFGEALDGEVLFDDGHGPDVVHAWTPREIVRTFSQAMQERRKFRLFVHMEDNEWHLLACALRRPLKQILALSESELDGLIPPHLTHPSKGVEFLRSADGISVIIDRLQELAPKQIPTLELWPSAEPGLFRPLPRTEHARRAAGIPMNSAVIVYTGNVHAANAHEVRSLYLAVAILNREGQPTTLVRTGLDFYPFLGDRGQEQWARRFSIELGLIPRNELPRVLALADVLVQPGRSDPFNDYRFPSKLPEFLAVGRPVIVPETNIATRMIHRRHAFVLPQVHALSIAAAVREILRDPVLRETLSKGALEFSHEHLSWERSASKLSSFYAAHERPGEQTAPSLSISRAGATLRMAQSAGL